MLDSNQQSDGVIFSAMQEAAAEGATAPPAPGEEVLLHFIALVHKDGSLYELDGRRRAIINHGPTTPENLLRDAAKVAQKFIDRTNSVNFNMIALAPAGAF